MKTQIRIFIITLLLGVFVSTSCEKDFDSINEDPNSITSVPSGYLLPGAIFTIASQENAFMENLAYTSAWIQQISCGSWYNNGRYYYEKSRGFLFDNLYVGPLKDLKTMYSLAKENNNQGQMAISLIMMSYAYALLTDCYGPIPFTEALSADENVNKPRYDSQEIIYRAVIDSLKSATNMLKGKTKIDIINGYDVLYDGDAEKWFKFSNALRLKLMMRISMKVDMNQQIKDLISDPELLLPQSNADNASYVFPGTAPKNYNPFYSNLSAQATDGGYRLCNTLVDYMKASNDPRLSLYGLPNDVGEYNGLASGTGFDNDDQTYSKVNPYWGESNRPADFMTYSEVLFLIAEVCQRGIISDDASVYYSLAIKANFDDLGISQQDFDAFITEPSVTFNNTLKIIMEQKWITLFTRGIEAWSEQKRTGYPALIPVAGGAVNVIPYRFQYTIAEEQSNNQNLMEAISTLSNGDALDSKIWWINL